MEERKNHSYLGDLVAGTMVCVVLEEDNGVAGPEVNMHHRRELETVVGADMMDSADRS